MTAVKPPGGPREPGEVERQAGALVKKQVMVIASSPEGPKATKKRTDVPPAKEQIIGNDQLL